MFSKLRLRIILASVLFISMGCLALYNSKLLLNIDTKMFNSVLVSTYMFLKFLFYCFLCILNFLTAAVVSLTYHLLKTTCKGLKKGIVSSLIWSSGLIYLSCYSVFSLLSISTSSFNLQHFPGNLVWCLFSVLFLFIGVLYCFIGENSEQNNEKSPVRW